MKISIDPPRHALQVEFKVDNSPPESIHVVEGIEIRLCAQGGTLTLQSVHFLRHRFRLPFSYQGTFAVDSLCLECTMSGTTVHVRLNPASASGRFSEIRPWPGLVVETSQEDGERRALMGFRVDTASLPLAGPAPVFELQVSADLLK